MEGRRNALIALALVAVTALAHGGVLTAGFVEYDDDLYVSERPEVLAGLTRAGLAWAFTSFQGANWFPLTRLSWMSDAQLAGAEPSAFHATSLLLHLLCVVLLFLALRRMLGEALPAAFVAAVFALHPLHVESVAWISSRKDVLSGVFFMLALGLHASGRRFGVALALGLGLLAKPMLVTLPFVLLLLDFWPLRRLGDEGRVDGARLRRALVEKWPLFVLVIVMSAVTLVAQRAGGAVQSLEAFPFGVRVENALDAPLRYLAHYFAPTRLAVFYPHPGDGLPLWRPALGALLVFGGLALGVALRRRAPQVFVGWAWFLGMLVPVSGLVQVGQAAVADRYTYLPAIGLTLALVWSVREAVAERPLAARAATALGLALLATLGLATRAQVGHWQSGEALFRRALAVTEDNAVAHTNLAVVLARSDRRSEALRHLDRALAIAPGSAIARGLRGELWVTDDPARAAADLRIASGLEADEPRWHTALGRALADRDPSAAEEHLRAALALAPDHAPAHAFLGALLQRGARRADAAAHYERALRDVAGLERGLGEGGVARLHAQHAELLQQLGRSRDAASAYERALAGGERTPLLLNNYAWLLATAEPGVRAPERAVTLALEAVSSSGGAPGTLDTLAAAYAAKGDRASARAAAARALIGARAAGDEALVRSLLQRFPEL